VGIDDVHDKVLVIVALTLSALI